MLHAGHPAGGRRATIANSSAVRYSRPAVVLRPVRRPVRRLRPVPGLRHLDHAERRCADRVPQPGHRGRHLAAGRHQRPVGHAAGHHGQRRRGHVRIPEQRHPPLARAAGGSGSGRRPTGGSLQAGTRCFGARSPEDGAAPSFQRPEILGSVTCRLPRSDDPIAAAAPFRASDTHSATQGTGDLPPAYSALLVEHATVRQVFNDTDRDALLLVVGAPLEGAQQAGDDRDRPCVQVSGWCEGATAACASGSADRAAARDRSSSGRPLAQTTSRGIGSARQRSSPSGGIR
jgi:hypothetical protein